MTTTEIPAVPESPETEAETAPVPSFSAPRRSVVSRAKALFAEVWAFIRSLAKLIWRFVGPVVSLVTAAGWLVLAIGGIAIVLSLIFGWQEFTYLGFVLLAAFVLASLFLVGRSSYSVLIELNPRRVVVGDRAMGRMVVTNTGQRAVLPARMELPVGKGLAEFQLPAMKPKAEHDELFAVPTSRRAVIVAGPALSIRGDQLGLLRRAVKWADPVELFVHPLTVRLTPSAAGLVRDLEGQVSKKITNSDISFHALRTYVPGDDRRYVHWRTSARVGQLMVRQFEETRRSQVTMIHTALASHYASDEEFELAVSVTASIAQQIILDGTQMSVVSEDGIWKTHTPTAMLDASCRVEPAPKTFPSVRVFARERTKRLPPPSVIMIVAGSLMTTTELRSIQSLFGSDTTQVAFRIEAGAAPRLSEVAGLTVMTIGELGDLPKLMRRLAG